MEFLILVHCAALRKETSQSEEKVTTSGYCTKIKVNNCLCTYIHLYTVVEASWSRIYCTVNVFTKKVTQIYYSISSYKALLRIITEILIIPAILKFIYSEKATIFLRNLHLTFDYIYRSQK